MRLSVCTEHTTSQPSLIASAATSLEGALFKVSMSSTMQLQPRPDVEVGSRPKAADYYKDSKEKALRYNSHQKWNVSTVCMFYHDDSNCTPPMAEMSLYLAIQPKLEIEMK